MRFEWDAAKAARNLRKHGVDFSEALTVFFDPLASTFEDPDRSNAERRWITIGYSSRDRLLLVCHTERERALRIINARPATRRERKRHET